MDEARGQSESQRTAPAAVEPHELLDRIARWRKQKRWTEIADCARQLPPDWGHDWLEVAGEIGFACTQVGRFADAVALYGRCFEIEPSHRLASGLAYVHYAALLAHKIRKPRLDEPGPWRKGFERWIAEALRLKPASIVDRYRLGIYHAQIQTQKDVQALRAFQQAIALYERRPAAVQQERNRDFKAYVLSLYGAARSAFRLQHFDEARRWIYRCIRLDKQTNHQDPVFKLFLAAKILVELKQYDDAERALRLALEPRFVGDRDFVYGLLAEIALAQDRPADAAQWIELHVAAHHRKPYLWRLLGDAEVKRGRPDRALKLYKSSLLKDHGGRHLTLARIGRLHENSGRLGEAKQAYEQAADFRRRKFLSEDAAALEALARVCERCGDREGARRALQRLARLPMFAAQAQQELARLAG
jgi:tetratricopeptide (TPR) repeat protein